MEDSTGLHSELAASVVRQKPDLIFVAQASAVRALKLATTSIPVVGVTPDPVAYGIVESLGRPGAYMAMVFEEGRDFNAWLGELGRPPT